MRRYAATFLSKLDRRNVKISIPADMYELSGFERFGAFHFALAVVRDERRAPLLERRNSVSISLIPFPREIIHRLYYVEVNIESQPNTLASVLACLRENKINIWDCNSVDTYQGGVAELIVALNEQVEGGQAATADILEGLLRGVVESVTVSKAIEDVAMAQLVGEVGGDCVSIDVESGRLFHREKEKISLQIPPLKDLLSSKAYVDLEAFPGGTYVNLVFDNKAKLLQAFFREPEEIILQLEVEFILKKHGQLEGVVAPLGRLAVDLRLIHAKTGRDHKVNREGGVGYDIVGNIQHTKLRLFDRKTLLAVIKAEIEVSSLDGRIPLVEITDVSPEGGRQVVSISGCSSALVENRLVGINLLPAESGSGRSHVVFYSPAEDSGGYRGHLLYDVGRPDSLGLFKFTLSKHDISELDLQDILSLVSDSLSATLKILRDRSPELIAKKFEAQFLVEVSDMLFAALVATHLTRLCELISKVTASSDHIRLFRECRVHFGYVKHGMLPFARNKRYLLMRMGEEAKFAKVDLSTEDGDIIRSGIESFVQALELAANVVDVKGRFDSSDLARQARSIGLSFKGGVEEPR